MGGQRQNRRSRDRFLQAEPGPRGNPGRPVPGGLRQCSEGCRAGNCRTSTALPATRNLPSVGRGPPTGRDMVSVNYIMRHLKVGPDDGRGVRWYAQIDQGMVLSAVIESVNALAAGACNYALVWRALHRPRGAYGSGVRLLRPGRCPVPDALRVRLFLPAPTPWPTDATCTSTEPPGRTWRL